MDLRDYPRPRNDTGIGVHWSAGASDVSSEVLRSFWIPELQALGVKWVKIPTLRNALPLAEEFLAAEIMPIVHVRRHRPLPSSLAADQIDQIRTLIGVGVRYFELDTRPDQGERWQRGTLPANALAQLADLLSADVETVLALGGAAGLPALAPESNWNLVAALVARQRADLLQGAVWQAVHNLGLNRPPTYPYDLGNQEGAPLTQAFYGLLAQEAWDGDAWQGRDLAAINQLRRQIAATPADERPIPPDAVHWRSYERLHQQHVAALGRPLPVLSTAGGWIVGSDTDPRYPAVTPALHVAYTLEVCRSLMGTSRRHAPAPDFYFCTAFWLLANRLLESERSVPERDAWYSYDHPQHVLPVVLALKAEPKRARARALAPEPPPVGAAPEPPSSVAAVQVIDAADIPATSRIHGRVRGGAGATIRLVDGTGTLYTTLARANGDYHFVDLPAGRYTVWVHDPPGSRREGIDLDGENSIEVPLSRSGWGTEMEYLQEETEQKTTLRCRVEASVSASEAGALSIRLRRLDESSGRVINMARRADGTTGCEVKPVASGLYRVEVLGVLSAGGDPHPLEALVQVQPETVTQLTFVYSSTANVHRSPSSQISGRVADGAGMQLQLQNQTGKRWQTTVDAEEGYRFEHLPAGVYQLHVVGHEASTTHNRIALDGKLHVRIDFVLPEQVTTVEKTPDLEWGSVRGSVPGAANEIMTLLGQRGRRYTQRTDQGRVWFPQVQPDTYTLSGGGYFQPGLDVYANLRLLLEMPPLDDEGLPQAPLRLRYALPEEEVDS